MSSAISLNNLLFCGNLERKQHKIYFMVLFFILWTSQFLVQLPYAHSSLTEDTCKNQVHLETQKKKASYLLHYFKC